MGNVLWLVGKGKALADERGSSHWKWDGVLWFLASREKGDDGSLLNREERLARVKRKM